MKNKHEAPIKYLKSYINNYLNLGISILPLHTVIEKNNSLQCSCGFTQCTAPAKHPVGKLVPKGLKQASSDHALVKKWFAGFAPRNVGIATGKISEILVLDIDPRHGGDESLQSLEAKYGVLPYTLRWRTGGGGQHIIFRYPGTPIRNSVGALGSGIDVRADGGYVVAPPSRHNSGNYYELFDGIGLDTPLALPPDWLINLMQQQRTSICTTSEKSPVKKIVQEPVSEGARNSTITRIVGHLLAKRVDPQICLSLMQAFNEKYCTPPLDEKEVERTVLSIDRISSNKRNNKN